MMRPVAFLFLTLALTGCDSQAPIEVQDIAIQARFLPEGQRIEITAYNRTNASLVVYGCGSIWYEMQRHTNGRWENDVGDIKPLACNSIAYTSFWPDLRYVRTSPFERLIFRLDPSPGTYRAYLLTGKDRTQLDTRPDTTFSEPFTVSAP